MILRDEAKKSAQKSSEEAAIDVKFTVNLHFSSINCSGDNLYFIDPFQRYLLERQKKANQRSFRKRVGGRVVLGTRNFGKVLRFHRKQFCKQCVIFQQKIKNVGVEVRTCACSTRVLHAVSRFAACHSC